MRFALDYDGTFTEDNELWTEWVKLALSRGHEVKFVTYRYEREWGGIEEDAKRLGIEIVYTGRKQKSTVYNADVWIDNQPELIPTLRAVANWTDE